MDAVALLVCLNALVSHDLRPLFDLWCDISEGLAWPLASPRVENLLAPVDLERGVFVVEILLALC